MYDSINFGLFRATLSIVGGCIFMIAATWMILTERSKINAGPRGTIILKTIMVLLAAFVIYTLLPGYVQDVSNLEIHTASGQVTSVDIFPPPIYFLSQDFNFDGQGLHETYSMNVSTFYVVKGRSYQIQYLLHSRIVLTIKEISDL